MAFLLKPILSSTVNLTVKSCPSSIFRFIRIVSSLQKQLELCTQTKEKLNDKEADLITPAFQIATNHVKKIAIKDKHGTHTYRDLLAKSLKLAQIIRNTLGPNKTQERIVFLCPNDMTYVLAQWACWASGNIGNELKYLHTVTVLY